MDLGLSYEYIKLCVFYKHNFEECVFFHFFVIPPMYVQSYVLYYVGDICQFRYVYVRNACSSDSDIAKILMYLFIYLFIYIFPQFTINYGMCTPTSLSVLYCNFL